MDRKKLVMIYITICMVFTSCSRKETYTDIDTAATDTDIGNLSQEYGAAASGDYIYYFNVDGMIYKINCSTNQVTFVCSNPTCPHNTDCASIFKFQLQTSGNQLFAKGKYEVENGSTVVYSSFGEIKDGEYRKILEADTMINCPSITKNRILTETDNAIKLVDINSRKVIKEYPFHYALSLSQLYCQDNTIYFINGLGELHAIDVDTGEVTKLSKERIRLTIPVEEYIFYLTDSKNQLCCMKKDGTEIKVLSKGVRTFNISGDVVYFSKIATDGIFTMDLYGSSEKKISDLGEVGSILLFRKQKKMIAYSGYENCYVGDMSGNDMKIHKLPDKIITND